MANKYFRNAGTGWATDANWSTTDGGAADTVAPTASDVAIFTSNSGNCNQNSGVTKSCAGLIFSGMGAGNYSGTFTFTQSVQVAGNVTLSATMTIASTGGFLVMNGSGTLTSNGKSLGTQIQLAGTAQTYTLADDWQVTSFSVGASSSCVLNGLFNMKISASWTSSTTVLTGTSTLLFNGTGTYGFANSVGINVTINTAGTITLSASTNFGSSSASATFKYIAGTIVNTGSTFTFNGNATGTIIDASGMRFNNVTFAGSSGIMNLLSDMYIDGTAQFGNGSGALTATGSFTVYCAGNITMGSTGSFISSTWIVEATGNCTLTSSGKFCVSNLRINCGSNTFTHSQNGTILGANSNTLTITYVSGKFNIASTSSIFFQGNIIFDTNPIIWNQLDFANGDAGSGTRTFTLNSVLRVLGLLRLGGYSTTANTWNETFDGTAGFDCGSLIIDCANMGRNITFAAGITYKIRNLFVAKPSFTTSNLNLKSGTAGSRAKLLLDINCIAALYGVNITDLDCIGTKTTPVFANGITVSTLSNSAGWQVIPVNQKYNPPSGSVVSY